jgi:hypothetical protein
MDMKWLTGLNYSILGRFRSSRTSSSATTRRGLEGPQLHPYRCCSFIRYLRIRTHDGETTTSNNDQGVPRDDKRVLEGSYISGRALPI